MLEPALGNEQDFIVNEVEQQKAHLYKITDKDTKRFYCYMVLRFEEGNNDFVLVLVAVAGSDSRVWMPYVIEWAKREGFDSIRLHTNIVELEKVNFYGFKRKEIIYQLEL